MSIKVETNKDSTIKKIFINNEPIENLGSNIYSVTKGLLKGIKLKEMPDDVMFELCDNINEKGTIILNTIPITVSKISDTKAQVVFSDSGRRKYWDGIIGFKYYMETKRNIIKEREKEIGDIAFVDYEDEGDYIFLMFSSEIESEIFDNIIYIAEQLIDEIEGSVELEISSPFKRLKDIKDEKDFTLSIVIPILRKLGFSDIRYNHGVREFGKDVVFSRKTEFDDFEFWGTQVKFGDISGGINSDIEEIIGQIDYSFKTPFYDIYTKQKRTISKLLIAISGKFTDNAIIKICEKIESRVIRNNIVFIDGEKIENIAEKFRKSI